MLADLSLSLNMVFPKKTKRWSPKLYDIEVNGEICVCRGCNNGQYWANWAALIHRLCGVSVSHPPSPTQTIVMCIRLYTKHALWPSIESDIWMSTSELFLFLFDTLTCICPFVYLYFVVIMRVSHGFIKIHWRPKPCIVNASQVSRGVLWHAVIILSLSIVVIEYMKYIDMFIIIIIQIRWQKLFTNIAHFYFCQCWHSFFFYLSVIIEGHVMSSVHLHLIISTCECSK